jgi:type I restriction enzyme R subunit
MPGSNEAFSYVKIGAWPKDQGWGLLDIKAVRFEYVLLDKMRADNVLRNRNCHRQLSVVAKAQATCRAFLSRSFTGDLTAAGRVPPGAAA